MFGAVTQAVVSLALVTVIWFTLAPVFGLTVLGERRSSASDYSSYYSNYYANPGHYDYSEASTGYQYESPYYAEGRSLEVEEQGVLARLAGRVNRSGLG